MRNPFASEVLSFLVGGNPSTSRRFLRGSCAACSVLGSRAHLSVGSAVRCAFTGASAGRLSREGLSGVGFPKAPGCTAAWGRG